MPSHLHTVFYTAAFEWLQQFT